MPSLVPADLSRDPELAARVDQLARTRVADGLAPTHEDAREQAFHIASGELGRAPTLPPRLGLWPIAREVGA